MEGTCVACGEVAEGKPIYKKLGSTNLEVEVYDALIEMQLLSLPKSAKTDCYICWDCDETISEEYTNFVETERKRKSDERKRKEQDVVGNQKLNKKLTQALKKAHKQSLISKGDVPPVSKYRQKEQKKVANRYYASNCLVCRNPFKSSKVGFLRFNMKKMVDDHCNVYEALKKLGTEHVLDANQQMRRFICCQCYNKVRRTYKGAQANPTSHPNGEGHTTANSTHETVKRPTFHEHAAEIAKLIPPGLADMYKVIGTDAPKQYKASTKDVDVLDDLSYTESDSDSSSDDSVGEARLWNPKTPISSNTSSIRTIIPNKSSSSQKEASSANFFETGICSLCGLCYNGRPRSFWYSLMDKIPPVSNVTVTVFSALQALEMRLISVNKLKNNREYVCKPCYSRLCTGFKSKIYQSIASKKGKSYGSLNTSNLKIDVVPPNGDQLNGMESAYHRYTPRPLSIKNKLAKRAQRFRAAINNQQSETNGEFSNITMRGTRPVNNSGLRRYAINNEVAKRDGHLLGIINKSQHLRYKGQAVYLRSVDVNVVDIVDALGDQNLPTVYTERLQDVHVYSNYMRSVGNDFEGKCILCLSEIKKKHCRWLEDPVCPPHLMVPLRWARLSLGPPDESTNLSVDDGKVCTNCYAYVKSEFMKFVTNKIGLSLDDGKVSLKKYKVSFDSVAMSVVADPLVPLSETRKKNNNTVLKNGTDTTFNEKTHIPKQPPKSDVIPESGKMLAPEANSTKVSPNKDDPGEIEGQKVNSNVSHFKVSSSRNNISSGASYPQDVVSEDGRVSDSESLSSSISNYSDEFYTKGDKANITNLKSNITEFKATKQNSQSDSIKDCGTKTRDITSTKPGPASSYNRTGQKRKHDTPPEKSNFVSESKRQKLEDTDKYAEPIIQLGTNNKKRLFEDDQFDEDYFQSSEDQVAPFAQRKKIRSRPTIISEVQESTPNETKSITKSYENIWQILQEISIDCLLSSNEAQPVKPESFTHGFLCALNFIKDEIGASDSDVVHWLCKVFPTEFRNLGRKLCKETVLSYLGDMYVEKEHIEIDIINEALPLSFYVPLKANSENTCCFENILNMSYQYKSIDWHYYLQVVNMDKLIDGQTVRTSHEEFNSGLIYSLWRANEYFGGHEDNLVRWMRLTAPEEIPRNCYLVLARNAKNSHRFISENPSLLVNLKVPIIVSNEELQQVIFSDNKLNICCISRSPTIMTNKSISPEKIKMQEFPDIPLSLINNSPDLVESERNEFVSDIRACDTVKLKDNNASVEKLIQDSSDSDLSLTKFDYKGKAITKASTSKDDQEKVAASMQLLPVVQPSGIITLVPVKVPNSPVMVLSPNLKASLPMSFDQIPQIDTIAPYSCIPNMKTMFPPGAQPITLKNDDHLNRRIVELEKKLKDIEEQNEYKKKESEKKG